MFNNIGLPGLLLIAVVVIVMFGRGKITAIMGEVGKGITAFKRGVSEDREEKSQDEAKMASEMKSAEPKPGAKKSEKA